MSELQGSLFAPRVQNTTSHFISFNLSKWSQFRIGCKNFQRTTEAEYPCSTSAKTLNWSPINDSWKCEIFLSSNVDNNVSKISLFTFTVLLESLLTLLMNSSRRHDNVIISIKLWSLNGLELKDNYYFHIARSNPF